MRDAFGRGLEELERHLSGLDDDALTRAVDAFRQAIADSPGNASFHLALAFALDAEGKGETALLEAGEASRIDPASREAEVLHLTLLAEGGEDAEALRGIAAAAPRHEVDVDGLRQELEAAGMPTDALTLLRNGFLSPRNWIRSWLLDEIERASRGEGTGRPPTAAGTWWPRCPPMRGRS